MAREVQLMVTQPVHGSHGDLIRDVGELLPLDAELAPDVRVTEVIVTVPDAPAAVPGPPAGPPKAAAAVPPKDPPPPPAKSPAAPAEARTPPPRAAGGKSARS